MPEIAHYRIAFNATSLIPPITGIGRYTRELTAALVATGKVNPMYFSGYRWLDSPDTQVLGGMSSLRTTASRRGRFVGMAVRVAQQLIFSRGVRKRRPDLYHDPNFVPLPFPGPKVITVHDLSPLTHPRFHPERRSRFMGKHLFPAIHRADAVITVSEYVRNQIIEMEPSSASKLVAIHNGVSEIFRTDMVLSGVTQSAERLRDRRFTLCVGTLEPRKNLLCLFRAYRKLPRELATDIPLVMAGGGGWLNTEIRRELDALVSEGRAVSLGYVGDADLAFLYRHTHAFVFPSHYEGFGLPIAEALACGARVIASDIPVHREVAGSCADYFNPDKVDSLAEILEFRLRSNNGPGDDEARKFRGRGYSWHEAAEKTLSVYGQVLG